MKYVVSWVETSRAFRLLVFCSADLTVMHELRSILPCGVSYSDYTRGTNSSRSSSSRWADSEQLKKHTVLTQNNLELLTIYRICSLQIDPKI